MDGERATPDEAQGAGCARIRKPPGAVVLTGLVPLVAGAYVAFGWPDGTVDRTIASAFFYGPVAAVLLCTWTVKLIMVSWNRALLPLTPAALARWTAVPLVLMLLTVAGGTDLRLRIEGDPRFGDPDEHQESLEEVILVALRPASIDDADTTFSGRVSCYDDEKATTFTYHVAFVPPDGVDAWVIRTRRAWEVEAGLRGWKTSEAHHGVYLSGDGFSFFAGRSSSDDRLVELTGSTPCTDS